MSRKVLRGRSLHDLLYGARSLYGLHGIERSTIKSAYHCGWRQHIDSLSGRPAFYRSKRMYRSVGTDKWVERAHGEHSLVNKEFRKIEP
jgi:hypothetical protein